MKISQHVAMQLQAAKTLHSLYFEWDMTCGRKCELDHPRFIIQFCIVMTQQMQRWIKK